MAKVDKNLLGALDSLTGKGSQSEPEQRAKTPKEREQEAKKQARIEKLKSLESKTVTVAFRVLPEEKEKIQAYFLDRWGQSLASGVKMAVYDFMNRNHLEGE